jgi:hypothetical protein
MFNVQRPMIDPYSTMADPGYNFRGIAVVARIYTGP